MEFNTCCCQIWIHLQMRCFKLWQLPLQINSLSCIVKIECKREVEALQCFQSLFRKGLAHVNRNSNDWTRQDGTRRCDEHGSLEKGLGSGFADLTGEDTLQFSRRNSHMWTKQLLPGKKFPIPSILFPFSVTSAQISTFSSQLINIVQLLAVDRSSLTPVCSHLWFRYQVSASSMQHSSHSMWKSTFASAFNVFLAYEHFFKSVNLLGQPVPYSFLPFPLPHQKAFRNDLFFAYPLNDHLPTCAFET